MRQESPFAVRGYFYTGHMFGEKCPDYRPCPVCFKCTKYSQHQLKCITCESMKPEPFATCQCTEEQRYQVIFLEELMGKPLLDLNADPTEMKSEEVCETAFNPYLQEMAEQMGISPAEAQEIIGSQF